MSGRPMQLHPCKTAHRVKLYPTTVYIPISCLRLREVLPAFFRTGQASLNRIAIPATLTLCQQNKPHTEMGLSGKYYGYPTDVLLHLFIPSVVTGFPASFHDSHKAAHVRPHTQGKTDMVVVDGLMLTQYEALR